MNYIKYKKIKKLCVCVCVSAFWIINHVFGISYLIIKNKKVDDGLKRRMPQ